MSKADSSRRRFLGAAGAATVLAYVPESAKGYAAPEMKVGTPKWDLDTPALCLDLDKMEGNFERAMKTLHTKPIEKVPDGD